MDINIDALYNILKQNQGDVNDAIGLKKKTVVVTFDPLALIAEKTKVSKRKLKVVVSLNSEGSDADDFSELKKITALLAKAFNRRKFYSKLTNNNLQTSSASQSANKKKEYIEGHFLKDCKKSKVKDYEYYKTKMLLVKKDKDEQVLLAEDYTWMESRSDLDQEINANMVFMAQIEKVLLDSEASSSSADDKISEVSYYIFESKSESEYETSKYYDNTTTYGLFVNDNDDQEIFHDCENFPENLIESQIDHNESAINHNDYEGIDKFIRKFNKKIAKCLKQKIIIDLEDEVVSLLDKEKENLKIIESLKSKDVEKGVESSEKVVFETEKSENDCQVIEKVYDSKENPNVIAPRMFKLSVSQSVLLISVTKMFCASNGVENLDTLSSVRRPKPSGVMWMKKESSNTVKADLSYVNHSNLNKNVKQYSRKNLMACDCPDLSLDHRFRMFKAYDGCYLLNNYDNVGKLKAKGDIRVFVGYSKESASFRIYNKQTLKEISNNEREVFHEVSESFQGESSSSSLNDDVQQSLEGVILPQINTQSISNNMVPNVNEASTSHNVFNERLEDAYFDANTSFHDPDHICWFGGAYVLGIKCSKSFLLLGRFPTASYDDPTAKYFATVSAKEFPLLVHLPTSSEEEFPLLTLAQVKERLAELRNQELKYCETIRVFEFKIEVRADCIESLTKELEHIKKEKEGLDSKLAGFQTASKDLDSLLESQRLDKNKEGLGYSAVPPPPAQLYSPLKKDLSWTCLPEFTNDTVTDYSRPSPAIESTSGRFPTASYDDPIAKYFATVSAKEFPLLVHFPTASEEEFLLLS
nr:retrovirus-related Pol polyprotein from transposon TNT 1-94 [Tanacetum cinerariifolium]